MELISKIQAIALGSITATGAVTLYTYHTSINSKKEKLINDFFSGEKAKQALEKIPPSSVNAFKGCVKNDENRLRSCGWVYRGIIKK